MQKWVFTSFYPYQWDLNFQNPRVLLEILDILFYLANKGVAMIRLDAIPFIWKDLGTNCRNRPTVHTLLKVFYAASNIVCPSLVLLGEAIVQPEEIVKYFGDEDPECPVMYNASGMVNLWNCLVIRNTTLFYPDHNRLIVPEYATWIHYARCHDDIGWGFNEVAIMKMGMDAHAHKQFLISFYEGTFEGSFSKGKLYEFDPVTLDARNSGTMASLCGLERSLDEKDDYQKALALGRIKLFHAFLLSSRGLPLLYSGDEIASLNDYSYLLIPGKSHDSHWRHRPAFQWERSKFRNKQGTPEYEVFQDLKRRIRIRSANRLFHAGVQETALSLGNTALYATRRFSEGRELICIFNFSEDRQFFHPSEVHKSLVHDVFTELIQGKQVIFSKSKLVVGPYEVLWLEA